MSNPTPISSAAVSAPVAPAPVQTVAAARRAAIRTALSMRLAPLAALVMLIVLVPLGFVANRQLEQTLRTQSDVRLQQAAQQYAALAQAIVGSQSATAPDSAVLTTLQRVFAAPGAAVSVDLADSSGHALITTRGTSASDASTFAATARAGADSVLTILTSRGAERAALASANFGRWVVLAHETVDQADATFYRVRSILLLVAALLFVIVVAIGFGVERLVNERIRRPALELANLAEAVAGGNLTVRVNPVESTSEIERLSRSLGTMVTELRRLARGLNEAAAETSAMSTEITASSAQMSSSAAQIAQTASDLSGQSSVMAESIQALAASSTSLTPLADRLNTGAHEGVSRNARLRTLASENRAKLDDSSAALETLVNDVEATASAVSALVDASEEIRTFVTLVQSLARNSRLLALNAAMEAARAGDQGEGFSVVATEVRRLAAMSSEAAERTQKVVGEVTANVERSREQMERMASAAREVRHATQEGSASFTQIEQSVAELEQWTTSIEAAATGTSALVNQMSERLDAVARGTETFAAAMEQVAAGSEQQSASTQEIAAAAGAMAQSAERLRTLVDNLRVGETRSSGARPAPAPSR